MMTPGPFVQVEAADEHDAVATHSLRQTQRRLLAAAIDGEAEMTRPCSCRQSVMGPRALEHRRREGAVTASAWS